MLFYVNFSELYEGREPDLTDHGDTSPGNECLCHISVSFYVVPTLSTVGIHYIMSILKAKCNLPF